jgi:hypothetical protein
VGERYKEVGKVEKGNDFISMAYRIYPNLHAEGIEAAELPERGKPKVVGEWHPSYNPIPQGVTADNAVKYQISRFLRGFFIENKETMMAAIDSRVYVPGVDKGLPKAEVEARIEYLFMKEDISTVPPSRICDLRSLTTAPVTRHIWKAEIDLIPSSEIDLGSYLPGDVKVLTFFFRLVGDTWLIFALGSLPPGIDTIVSPEETIRDTFIACINAFVNEQAEKTSRYFTDPFLNIPFSKDVSREELTETFKGYFEEYDFSDLQDQKVLFSILESREMPHPGGKTYKVQLDFGTGEADEFAFWRAFSGYYVVFDEREDAWRIFAIF